MKFSDWNNAVFAYDDSNHLDNVVRKCVEMMKNPQAYNKNSQGYLGVFNSYANFIDDHGFNYEDTTYKMYLISDALAPRKDDKHHITDYDIVYPPKEFEVAISVTTHTYSNILHVYTKQNPAVTFYMDENGPNNIYYAIITNLHLMPMYYIKFSDERNNPLSLKHGDISWYQNEQGLMTLRLDF